MPKPATQPKNSGLTCACRLLEAGYSVILVEKRDIPGGSMSMTYGGVATAGSKLQYNYDVDGSFRSSLAMASTRFT